ncbi:unnamed protein product [Closterium sp. NIES-64]|nr:unnamed protein product [Closterium sp. NIES-65]CAI5962305.1 unnamed protein product [Closterium sp. NIES-64]
MLNLAISSSKLLAHSRSPRAKIGLLMALSLSMPLCSSSVPSALKSSPSALRAELSGKASNRTVGICLLPTPSSLCANRLVAKPNYLSAINSGRASLFLSRARPSVTMAAAAATTEAAADVKENPLLSLNLASIPLFDKIEPKHVVPGMRAILKEVEEQLDNLEKNVQPTWAGLVEPVERIGDRLSIPWGAVNHLNAVKNSDELRAAFEEVQPDVVKLSLRLGQSRPLYDAFVAIRGNQQLWDSLSVAQKRVVESELISAKTSGVALEGEAKTRFNEIQQELAQLRTKFQNNVLDATKRFVRIVTDPADVAGLPPSALGLAAQAAVGKGHEGATAENGPWAFTLDMPSYLPLMQHCRNRGLREEVYRAFVTRASEGDIDNTPVITRILQLKQEKAKLLGFKSHAEVPMQWRMATIESAHKLVEDLRDAAFDISVKEHEELKAFAKEQGAEEADDLRQWDVTFWGERLREARYELTQEELRPYFSFPVVIDGLFKLASRLFDVSFQPADGEAPTWNPDVRYYKVTDSSGNTVASFLLDPYSRPAEKRGGAWMDGICNRSGLFAAPGAAARLPVTHIVCNQTPPLGDKPSLMTFNEVETLFHEFGHALQHMLTRQQEGLVAGISNVEWDAVELPSQFMENWCYHRATLLGIARHYETGEVLPEELYNKIVAAKNFRSATMTMRQLHFAAVDLELHCSFDPEGKESIYDVNSRVAERMLVLPPLPSDRFLCSFLHIFAGGYDVGYYSYKWAEVLSADAFAAFEEAGLDDDEAVKATGHKFRDTVLALGGGAAAKDVFAEFRGRQPSIEPLLRHNGLVPEPVPA